MSDLTLPLPTRTESVESLRDVPTVRAGEEECYVSAAASVPTSELPPVYAALFKYLEEYKHDPTLVPRTK
jgi:hypothetical protein